MLTHKKARKNKQDQEAYPRRGRRSLEGDEKRCQAHETLSRRTQYSTYSYSSANTTRHAWTAEATLKNVNEIIDAEGLVAALR